MAGEKGRMDLQAMLHDFCIKKSIDVCELIGAAITLASIKEPQQLLNKRFGIVDALYKKPIDCYRLQDRDDIIQDQVTGTKAQNCTVIHETRRGSTDIGSPEERKKLIVKIKKQPSSTIAEKLLPLPVSKMTDQEACEEKVVTGEKEEVGARTSKKKQVPAKLSLSSKNQKGWSQLSDSALDDAIEFEQKLNASKRKLAQEYEQIKNARKKIQVIDFKDIPSRPGLAVFDKARTLNNRRKASFYR